MLVSKNNLNNNRGILQLKHYPIPTNIAAAGVTYQNIQLILCPQ